MRIYLRSLSLLLFTSPFYLRMHATFHSTHFSASFPSLALYFNSALNIIQFMGFRCFHCLRIPYTANAMQIFAIGLRIITYHPSRVSTIYYHQWIKRDSVTKEKKTISKTMNIHSSSSPVRNEEIKTKIITKVVT